MIKYSDFFVEVYNPWDVSPDINRLFALPWIIRVSSAGVFVCIDHMCYWSSGTSVLSGHRLEHIVRDKLSVDNNFELIAGGGLKEDFGKFSELLQKFVLYLFAAINLLLCQSSKNVIT